MYKLIDFIEKHKCGVLITIGVHVALFFYFQIATYEEKIYLDKWEIEGRYDEKEDIEITPDQIKTPEEQELFNQKKEVKNMVSNLDDKRDKVEDPKDYTSSVSENTESAYDVEEAMKNEISAQSEGSKPSKQSVDVGDQDTPKTKPKTKPNKQTASSKNSVDARTMVSFQLTNRTPLNNNDWYVRNPGYTCGNVDGIVVIEIKVGQNGRVESAKYNSGRSKNASACMIEKAEEYALKSRFNYSDQAPRNQSGFIQYTFIYQK